MKVEIEDRSRIRKVNFIHPMLMNEEAELYIRQLYNDMLETEDQLDKARELVRNLENELKIKKANFNSLDCICTLEFEKKEEEHVDKVDTSSLGIVNPTDGSSRYYNSN